MLTDSEDLVCIQVVWPPLVTGLHRRAPSKRIHFS